MLDFGFLFLVRVALLLSFLFLLRIPFNEGFFAPWGSSFDLPVSSDRTVLRKNNTKIKKGLVYLFYPFLVKMIRVFRTFLLLSLIFI